MAGSKWLQLPPSVLLAVFAYVLLATGTPTPTPTANISITQPTIAPTGSGPEYASACWKAQIDYDQASSSWTSAHGWTSTTTELVGGTSFSEVTYYENATTLCDGHARVTYSPAISLSTGTITYPGNVTSTSTILDTYFSNFPQSIPTCSIEPSDCDGLWKAYSTSLSAAGGQTTNPPLETPPCMGRSAASSYASVTEEIYGCGDCTIYGNGVELVYFPTYPSNRDMCASTPTATLTHYGPGAVITAYAGKSYTGEGDAGGKKTAVVDGHTFTSGTAYISISTVYAVDRCSKTFGTPVKDAILAMPSESVLSLRYEQNHFQQLMSTDRVTGYPVSYADFNSPIPWSAWNGQNMCDPGGYGGWACSIIYEHSFRPQLAIPPEITQLSPDFKNCQMWYNGLWDPPLALTEAASEAKPTLPGGGPVSTPATPNSTPAAPTAQPTAIPNELPSTGHGGSNDGATPYPNGPSSTDDSASPSENNPTPSGNGPTFPADGPTLPASRPTGYNPAGEPWVQSFHVADRTYWATGANNQCRIDGVTMTAGGPTQTLSDGTRCSYGTDGLILKGSSTVSFDDSAPKSTPQSSRYTPADEPWKHSFRVGEHTYSATASNNQCTIDGVTLTAGGPTKTLKNGAQCSYGADGLIINGSNATGSDESSPEATDSAQHTGSSGSNDGPDTVVVTVNGQKATAVRTSNGGPVVIGGSMTLTAGAPATTLSNGEVLSAASDGLVVGYTTTLGTQESGESQSSQSNGEHSDNGASGTSTGTRTSNAQETSDTTSGDSASSTGSASSMSPAQALSLFAAIFAMVIAGG